MWAAAAAPEASYKRDARAGTGRGRWWPGAFHCVCVVCLFFFAAASAAAMSSFVWALEASSPTSLTTPAERQLL